MKNISKNYNLNWIWLSLFIVILDQGTKLLVIHYLTYQESIAITPFFNLVLTHNTGAAFSFLNNASGWQIWLFGLIAVVISSVIVIWLYNLKPKKIREALALTLILGGAVSNLLDRLVHGFVIDFLDFYFKTWHWPAFNIADSSIVIGAIILAVGYIKNTK
jgi:signal peptidase II